MPLWLAIALVLAAIVVSMGPVVLGGFSYWDDEDTISLNPGFNPPTWASLADRWARPHLHIYVPLTHTVWHVLALISPKPPPGGVGNVIALPFKLASLGMHTIASVLVLMALRRLVGPRWPAVAGAIAFAVHPVQVESVAWASGLKDVMFGMFAAGCVLAYVGGERDALRPRGRNTGVALLLLTLAGLSKPTAMVVPAILLALDLLWLRRPAVPSIVRLLPFAIVAGAFAGFAWLVQPNVVSSADVPLVWRSIVALDTLSFYLRKLFVPTGLAYDYGRTAQWVVAQVHERPVTMLTQIAVPAVAMLCVLKWWRSARLATTGVAIFLVALLPVLGFTHFDFAHYSTVSDHYVYLPMLGVAITIAAALDASRQRRQLLVAVTIVVVVTWVILSYRQAITWRTALSVTQQTLRVNDRSYASWGNLALTELRAGNVDAAESHARRAVALSPNDPQSAFVLANVLQERGNDLAAIEWVRTALKQSPYSAAYHHRLGMLLGKTGQFDEALAELDRAVVLDSTYPGAAEQAAQLQKFMRQRPATTQTGGVR